MIPLALWCVVCSICFGFAENQDVTLNVTGPEFLATDGTREMNLTCPESTGSDIRYNWFTPQPDTTRCGIDATGNVCMFRPTLEDDGKIISCTASNASHLLHSATYQVRLKYPPPQVPVIMTESAHKNALQHGDVIMCTVSGGKPLVTNVTFHCQNPDHPDQEDGVSGDGHNVSSFITLNASKSSSVSMNCSCSAYWAPEPGLYNYTTKKKFVLGNTDEQKGLLVLAIAASLSGASFITGVIVIAIIVKKHRRKEANKTSSNLQLEENRSPDTQAPDDELMIVNSYYASSEPSYAQVQGTRHEEVQPRLSMNPAIRTTAKEQLPDRSSGADESYVYAEVQKRK